jgi:N-acetylglucosamine repressor
MEPTAVSLLQAIHASQPITRRALAQLTGLSNSRINVLATSLTEARAIREEAVQQGGLGRPAALLSVNPDAGQIVGIDVGGCWSRAVLTDINGRVRSSVIHDTQTVTDRSVIIGNIVQLIQAVCESAGTLPADLAGLGVALCGLVDTRAGTVHDWPGVPAWADAWRGLDIRHELSVRLGISPICVDDRVRALAQMAHHFGLARDCSDFLYVDLSSGVSAAVFVGGQPYLGRKGMAGELGHVSVDEEGPWCHCGNRGCLEMMASTWAVLRRVQERLAESRLASALRDPFESGNLSLDSLIEAACGGDKLAFQVLDETGSYVGRVLAFAVNLLSPELVILGGPLVQDGGIILEAVQRQVRLHALQHIWKQTRIVCDAHDEFGGARGAALVATDTIFKSADHLQRLFSSTASHGDR